MHSPPRNLPLILPPGTQVVVRVPVERAGREPLPAGREGRIRVLGPIEPLTQWLRMHAESEGIMPGVEEGHEVAAGVERVGDRASQSRLLRAMVLGGFEIVEFGSQVASLEDVFMQVTQGKPSQPAIDVEVLPVETKGSPLALGGEGPGGEG
jgi:hypothetical protein